MLKKSWKRILIKLGSSVIHDGNSIQIKKIQEIIHDIHWLQKQNIEVILVSSGAIACGRGSLNKYTKDSIHFQQAASAVGQPLLMATYQKELAKLSQSASQILVTHQDFSRKQNFHNMRQTIQCLLDNKILPIINENDSVSIDEITLGDNDQLAARIAMMMSVDLVIYLTEADGILLEDGSLLKEADHLRDLNKIKRMKKTKLGSGGILTKLEAVKKLHQVNIDTLISSYKVSSPVSSAIKNQLGTWILASKNEAKDQHKQIVSLSKTNAHISIDDGAFKALSKNASLLPSGIIHTKGIFHRGDSILIKHRRKTIAYGVVEYSSKEVDLIKGKNSTDIKKILGYHLSNVVIHKNYLVLGNKK